MASIVQLSGERPPTKRNAVPERSKYCKDMISASQIDFLPIFYKSSPNLSKLIRRNYIRQNWFANGSAHSQSSQLRECTGINIITWWIVIVPRWIHRWYVRRVLDSRPILGIMLRVASTGDGTVARHHQQTDHRTWETHRAAESHSSVSYRGVGFLVWTPWERNK